MRYFVLVGLLISCFGFSQGGEIFNVARKGTVAEAEALLNNNPSAVREINESGFSPLILACYRGNTEVAKYLIDQKADLNYVSTMGTALMAAVVKGNTEIVQYLLEHHADPNIPDSNGTTALIYSVQFENTDLISILLKYNAEKSHVDKSGKTAFEYAVFSGNESIINLLK